MKERESALEQQYQELLDQTKRKLQTHEATIQRLTTTLSDKEQQLQVIWHTKMDFWPKDEITFIYHYLLLRNFWTLSFHVYQEYINMIKDLEQNRSPGSNDSMLTKLRQRLKEKENALEVGNLFFVWLFACLSSCWLWFDSGIFLLVLSQLALDEKFAAIEEKDNEIHQLQLLLREKERDLDRLNNLLTHNEETINVSSFELIWFLKSLKKWS